ncbi:acid resistance repetitive basic protein Asr [Escherichia coli]
MGLSSAAFAAETATTPAPTATTTKAAPAKTTHHKNSIKQHLPRKRRRLKSIIKMPKLNRKLLNKSAGSEETRQETQPSATGKTCCTTRSVSFQQ